MRNPDTQMLLRIAMADAYAAAAEYLKFPRDARVRERCLAFEGYVAHPTHLDHPASRYTDDAEMSIANAFVLIDYEPPYMKKMFADAYVREFAFCGRRTGYSRGFQAFLDRTASGDEFLAKIRPDSDKNGAAMRAVPFGVLPTVEDVLKTATLQATLTHDTAVGRFSARAVALMSHFALYEEAPLRELPEYCLSRLPDRDARQFGAVFRTRWSGRSVTSSPGAPVGLTTVHAVVDLVVHQCSLMEILAQTIRWGGDADSVAAIAWGVASPRFPHEPLPAFMERDLERGDPRTGAPRLRSLSERLMAKFA